MVHKTRQEHLLIHPEQLSQSSQVITRLPQMGEQSLSHEYLHKFHFPIVSKHKVSDMSTHMKFMKCSDMIHILRKAILSD